MGMNPLDPNGLITQLQQSTGAQLAGYSNNNKAFQDAALKSLFGANRSADMQAAISYPSAPSLKFSADPSFSQGVGEGIGNFYALKNYRTRTEMLNNAVLEERRKEKQKIDMLAQEQQEGQTRRTTGRKLLKPEEQGFYDVMTSEKQDEYLTRRGEGIGDAAMAPDIAAAKSKADLATAQDKLNWQRERFHALTGVFPEQVFAQGNHGALTPQIQSAWKYVYDTDPPKDKLDYNERFAKTGSAVEGYEGAVIDNQTRPQRNQAQLDATLLDNTKAEVELKYLDVLKTIDILKGQGKLEEANELTKRSSNAKHRYDQLVPIYDTLTPGEIKLYNSQWESYKLPFRLPEKKMTPIKDKGAVTGFTDSNGHVYDKNGKLKE